MVDMRNIATAWEARNSETGRYNAAGQANGVEGADQQISLDNLQTMLQPTYIRILPQSRWMGNAVSDATRMQPYGSATAQAKRTRSFPAGKTGSSRPIRPRVHSRTSTATSSTATGVFLSYPDGLTFNK